uniref:Uncharacterized protein n=1 Tax=viral metagenome TaxID=1070528 RepID=A0A6C0EET5_9ZZZZ
MKKYISLTLFIGSALLICISTFFKNNADVKALLYFILLIALLLVTKLNAFAVLITTLLIWLGDGLVQEFTKNQKYGVAWKYSNTILLNTSLFVYSAYAVVIVLGLLLFKLIDGGNMLLSKTKYMYLIFPALASFLVPIVFNNYPDLEFVGLMLTLGFALFITNFKSLMVLIFTFLAVLFDMNFYRFNRKIYYIRKPIKNEIYIGTEPLNFIPMWSLFYISSLCFYNLFANLF